MNFFSNRSTNNNTKRNADQNNNYQIQSQKYANKQSQLKATADRQTFKEAVHNTFEAVTLPAQMAQNPSINQSVVNSLTDGAMLALNMFTVACQDFIKDSDKDSIDLAKKTMFDKWNALKIKEPKTYQLTENHREFMNAALNGQKGLRYKTRRTDITKKKLFENDAETICDSYGRVINNNQEFDKRQQSFLEPETNKKLQQQHEKEIAAFRKNKKYNENGSASQKKYVRPNQGSFYFTKSGQNSQFKNRNADLDEKSMNDELMNGGVVESEYNKLPKNMNYQNAVLNLSLKNAWNNLTKPVPCYILYPDDKDKLDKIQVRCAYPFDNEVIPVPVKMLIFKEKTIKKHEKKHIKINGKLGYDSIEKQESAMDLD